MKNFLKNTLTKHSKHFLPLLVVLSLLISFINLLLFINLYFKSSTPILISESVPQPSPDKQEMEKSDKLAWHIERLIVLDAIFNSEKGKDLSVEELMIIDSLFGKDD